MTEATTTRPARSKKVWPSSLALLETCPAAGEIPKGDKRVDTTGEAAELGNVVHQLAGEIAAGATHDRDRVEEVARQNGMLSSLDTLQYLIWSANQAWHGDGKRKGLSRFFVETPQVEKRLAFTLTKQVGESTDSLKISGKIDVLGYVAKGETGPVTEARIIDWKSGRQTDESHYMGQMRAYGVLAATSLGPHDRSIKKVTVWIVWLRDQQWTQATFTREQLRDWTRELMKHAWWDGKTYNAGAHCQWCPRAHECEARLQMLRAHVAAFEHGLALRNDEGALLNRESIFKAWEASRVLERTLHAFKDSLKLELEKQGPMPIPGLDGKALAVVQRKGRAQIDAELAWPIVTKILTQDQLAPCVSIGKTALNKAIMAVTEKGQKKRKAEATFEQLRQAGAMTEGEGQRIVQVVEHKKSLPTDAK